MNIWQFLAEHPFWTSLWLVLASHTLVEVARALSSAHNTNPEVKDSTK